MFYGFKIFPQNKSINIRNYVKKYFKFRNILENVKSITL